METSECASSGQPQSIASRYLQRMMAGRDQKKYSDGLILQLKEALGTLRYYGTRERNTAEDLLLLDVEQRGNTRRTTGSKRLQDLAPHGGKLDEMVRHWEEDVLGRCEQLLQLVEEKEHSPTGYFHDSFLRMVRKLVDEVHAADWVAGPPHPSPWSSVPTFFDEGLLAAAKQTSEFAKKQRSFQFQELWNWSGVASATASAGTVLSSTVSSTAVVTGTKALRLQSAAADEAAAPHPSRRHTIDSSSEQFSTEAATKTQKSSDDVRLNISCCCIDDSEAYVSTVYLGTERGLILALPIESLYPQTPSEEALFASRSTQKILKDMLHRRTRVEEEAARLPRRTHLTSPGAMTHLSVAELAAAPPSPNASVASLPGSDAGASAPAGQAWSNAGFMMQDGPVRLYCGHVYSVLSLRVISHGDRGKLLVSTSVDKTLRWFNAATGAIVGIAGPERGVCSGAVGYLPAADTLLSGHYDGSLKLWDVQSGALVRNVLELQKCPIHSVHVVPATTSGPTARTQIMIGCRNGHVYGLHFTMPPSQKSSALADDASSATLTVSHCLLPEDAPGAVIPCAEGALVGRGGHTKAVLQFASAATFLFSADSEGRVVKWDLESGEKVVSFHSHIDDITAIVVTSDGFLFTSSRDGLWMLWDADDGSLLKRCGQHYHQVVGLVVGFRSSPPPTLSPADTQLSNSPTNSAVPSSQPPVVSGAKGKRGKKRMGAKQGASSSSELSFPLVPRALRRSCAGSRECIALQKEPAGQSDALFLLSVSKDDSLIVWSIDAVSEAA